MIKILDESAGDIILKKFLFISMKEDKSALPYHKYYDEYLKGYLIVWDYRYNKYNHSTDDENFPHSDVIESLPENIKSTFRNSKKSAWGRTDYYTSSDEIRFFINNEAIGKDKVEYIKKIALGIK